MSKTRQGVIGMERRRYQDPFNDNKIWEVTNIKGGIYLKQFIGGKQFGKGMRVTKQKLKELGIANMQEVRPSTLETLKEYKKRISKERNTGKIFKEHDLEL